MFELGNRIEKTLSFLTLASKMLILYCNLHIKLDIDFCAQARWFLKVAKPCEASLLNCVRDSVPPFKTTVRCVNSVFGFVTFVKNDALAYTKRMVFKTYIY